MCSNIAPVDRTSYINLMHCMSFFHAVIGQKTLNNYPTNPPWKMNLYNIEIEFVRWYFHVHVSFSVLGKVKDSYCIISENIFFLWKCQLLSHTSLKKQTFYLYLYNRWKMSLFQIYISLFCDLFLWNSVSAVSRCYSVACLWVNLCLAKSYSA